MRDFRSTSSTTRARDEQAAAAGPGPGKRTMVEMLTAARSSAPVQRKVDAGGAPAMPAGPRPTIHELFGGEQRKAAGADQDTAEIHASAQRGIATTASPLPHLDTIQRSFGHHDISGIQAHVETDAATSASAMGAQAYATGNHVVLGSGSADLHTAAHEAAHVVQQRAGVQLSGGVGAAGDAHERHADAVADLVVQGRSVEALLTQHTGQGPAASSTAGSGAVQRKVGFEFEAGLVASSRDPEGLQKLAKKDRLLTGDGFTVEADEQSSGSDVEFVTEPFEETKAGEQRAMATVERIVRFTKQANELERVRMEEGRTAKSMPKRLSIATMQDFGSPVANRYFQPGLWNAQVQVTAGILVGKLDAVMDTLGARPQGQLKEPEHEDNDVPEEFTSRKGKEKQKDKKEKEKEIEIEGPTERTPLLEKLPEAPIDTANLVNRDSDVGDLLPIVRNLLATHQLPGEITGVVALLALYLVRGAKGVPAYGKTISGPLMARTDFATIFTLLPPALQLRFKRQPNEFVNLVTSAAGAAAPDQDFGETQPIYAGGLYNDGNHYRQHLRQPDMTGLTIGAWLRAIVGSASSVPSLLKPLIGEAKGVDRLTATQFPGDNRAQGEIESLGGYGAKTDLHGGVWPFGGGKRMPIFEFRGLPDLPPDRWVAFVGEFLRWIVAINRGFREQRGRI